ncbi:cytoplasmic tRNA 2-thiolation protein 2 isoform X5 [Balaenoptera acutorostrata]|uniref:Cytoplasmic tRNA 2-thiolation protein 2 n=1 Tax=Balaenoptera acutorostrata TaxID=9767 RepID=A0A452C9W6_BALAC|nr:cytoplasmic tRNA 2-thiolation protein 2 isoform X5 [Balaenoptera acutorostrata]
MCEVGEDYRAPAGQPPPRPGREQKCVKCKEGLPVVVIRAGDAFCRDCFKAFYVHKFRAVLGKNRLIFPGEKVLLAWSGGPSSSSMLWQVLEGLSRDSAKRLRFVPGVVYADEGAACGQSPEDRAETVAEAKLVLQSVGFPWHIVALEELSGDADGQGGASADTAGFSDERHGDVVVVRPMREHTLKEVAFYNRLFAVPSVFTPAVDTKAPEKASIHRLMEAFILRLQAQFPSTVSTVYRTSEKLVKAPRDGCAAGTPGPRCLLCMCVLDVDTADSATAFGAQTSSQLPQTQPPVAQAEAPVSCCCTRMGGARHCCRTEEDPRARVIEQLCYGCRVNMKDLPSLDPLPPYILAEAQLRSQRAEAEQIQEYLLEDREDEDARPGES